MPFGLTSTIGARQSAGSVTRCEMLPSPALESGSVPVTAAGVMFVSAPQKSDAEIDVTGPGVPKVGITRPLTVRSSLPSLESVTLPRESTHGSPPGCTPWNIGSVGTLGASVERNERSPPDAAAIATTATTSAAAAAATSSASLLNGLSQLPPTVAPDDWTAGPTRRRDGRFVVASRRSGGRVLQAVADGGPEGEVLLDLLDRLVHELVVPIVVAQVGVDPFHAPEAIPAPLPICCRGVRTSQARRRPRRRRGSRPAGGRGTRRPRAPSRDRARDPPPRAGAGSSHRRSSRGSRSRRPPRERARARATA